MTGSGAASGQPMGRVYLHVFVLGVFVVSQRRCCGKPTALAYHIVTEKLYVAFDANHSEASI